MMWNPGWYKIFSENEMGKYPTDDLVRFMANNFYQAPSRKDIKVLEVGCGAGANVWYLAREGFDVTAIEGSSVAVERTTKRLAEDHLSARIIVGDTVKGLPFDDNQFDCVIDIECLYANTYQDTRKIIAEIKRVLKPKGLFFSKTFMTSSSGDGNGKWLEGEKNTYLETTGGALRGGYGISRFTSEEEIADLYGQILTVQSLDQVICTRKNRQHQVKEWLIVCSKS